MLGPWAVLAGWLVVDWDVGHVQVGQRVRRPLGGELPWAMQGACEACVWLR